MKDQIRLFALYFSFTFLVWGMSNAQEPDELTETTETTEIEEKHFISFTFGYTYIAEADELGSLEASGFLVPTFGLDYFHIIGRRWELGIMIDLELDHYLIVEKELERENAFIAALMVLRKLTPNWYLMGGVGIEIEGNKNLTVLRLGMERPFLLGQNWVLGPAVFYDIKEGYDTWSLSLGIGKGF